MTKKRGRPKLDESERLVSLHVMVSPGMKNEIDKNSIRESVTVSQLTRKLLSIGISIDHFSNSFGLTEKQIVDVIVKLQQDRGV